MPQPYNAKKNKEKKSIYRATFNPQIPNLIKSPGNLDL